MIMTYFHKSQRSVLRLSGDGALGFLHDILTASSADLAIGDMQQSCLLSPQGRILFEMSLYHVAQGEVLIEVDSAQADDLRKKLTLYRLRRPITITAEDDLGIIAWFDGTPAPHDSLAFKDKRHEDMGYRAILPKDEIKALPLGDYAAYEARRIALALPEGAIDLTPNRALMLEAGLDELGAVDFQKGCYIGQEVTARTRYRGLVKKRLMAVSSDQLVTGEAITLDDKEVGIIHSTAQGDEAMIGLVLLKLSAKKDVIEDGAQLMAGVNPAFII